MKKALITGITGQDGSYLAELLLEKGYEVHGIIRRHSTICTERIDHLYYDESLKGRFFLHYGDLTDSCNLTSLILQIKPKARVPISQFRVGAAAYTESGRIFLGTNMEFRNVAMNQVSLSRIDSE